MLTLTGDETDWDAAPAFEDATAEADQRASLIQSWLGMRIKIPNCPGKAREIAAAIPIPPPRGIIPALTREAAMDWDAAIEKNREALKRVLATLLAMAGLSNNQSPSLRARPGPRPDPESAARSDEGHLDHHHTLPRHLHRAILHLLRPAESAARRLVIVAARGLVVEPPRQRPQRPRPKTSIVRNGIGTGIVMPADSSRQAAPHTQRRLSLPLADPLRRLPHQRRQASNDVPRILFAGAGAPVPVPIRRPPSPSDPVDASRLILRLQALGRALDDLPGHARRFARTRAAAGAQNMKAAAAGTQTMESHHGRRLRRIWPLRSGRPPGHHSTENPDSHPGSRHPVHEILNITHGLAIWALEPADTT